MQMHTQTHIWVLLIWIIHRQACMYIYIHSHCFHQATFLVTFVRSYRSTLGMWSPESSSSPGSCSELRLWHGACPWQWPSSCCRCLGLHLLPTDLHKTLSPRGACCPGLGLSWCHWAAPLQSGEIGGLCLTDPLLTHYVPSPTIPGEVKNSTHPFNRYN